MVKHPEPTPASDRHRSSTLGVNFEERHWLACSAPTCKIPHVIRMFQGTFADNLCPACWIEFFLPKQAP